MSLDPEIVQAPPRYESRGMLEEVRLLGRRPPCRYYDHFFPPSLTKAPASIWGLVHALSALVLLSCTQISESPSRRDGICSYAPEALTLFPQTWHARHLTLAAHSLPCSHPRHAGFLYTPRDKVFSAIASKQSSLQGADGVVSVAIAGPEVRCMALLCDDLTIAVGCSDGSVQLYDARDVASGKTVYRHRPHLFSKFSRFLQDVVRSPLSPRRRLKNRALWLGWMEGGLSRMPLVPNCTSSDPELMSFQALPAA